jgi:hypothetical protein
VNFEPEIAAHEEAAARDLDIGVRPAAAQGSGDFAAVPLLRDFLRDVPATTQIVLVMVPHYYVDLPIPDTPAAAEIDLGKAKFRELAAERPNTFVLDFRNDGELARDRHNFWNRNHYRMPIARLIEAQIAAALHRDGDE